MTLLSRAAAPFVRFLAATTEGTLRLLGVRKSDEPPVTEAEIQGLMRQGMEAGVFEQEEHALVARVFKMDERKIPAIMTPRVDLVYLDVDDDLATNLKRVTEARYTRYPLCQDGWSNVIGVVSTVDLLEQALAGAPIDLRALRSTGRLRARQRDRHGSARALQAQPLRARIGGGRVRRNRRTGRR